MVLLALLVAGAHLKKSMVHLRVYIVLLESLQMSKDYRFVIPVQQERTRMQELQIAPHAPIIPSLLREVLN